MSRVVIYTKSGCRFCQQAKNLLSSKGFMFKEKDITYDVLLKREMIELSGGRVTTPQVFIDGRHIGGCDDIFMLDKKNQLIANDSSKRQKAG